MKNFKTGTIIREVLLPLKESVEKKEMTPIHAIRRSQRPLVLADRDNDIFLEGHKGLTLAASDVEPIFLFFAFFILVADSLIRLAHGKQHGVGIHANARFLGFHGFLKLGRK